MSTVPTIVVKDIQISPNNCLLQEKLNLTVIFEIDGVINKGWWHTKYIVDFTNKRHIIEIGKSKPEKYEKGQNTFSLSVNEINVEGMSDAFLNNMGLLVCTLHDDKTEIFQLSMVVQIQKGEKKGEFIRNILNPLQ